MNFKTSLKFLFTAACILLMFTSCSKDELDNYGNETAITVKLKGAENNLQNLMIDIKDVQLLIGADANTPGAWMSLDLLSSGVYNVTQLNNDNELILVDGMLIPSGEVQQIKLLLGNDNAIIVHNQSRPLGSDAEELASSNIVAKRLASNKNYEFTLEFESDNSIIVTADDSINFVPKMNTLIRHLQY
ncbi:DUF4382 domain-containing protein [Subsaximicrobium wynnwilliamsii]|nr:DUF4382 domain-containing protein [Subsaximicrobium wynnwilliamsii]